MLNIGTKKYRNLQEQVGFNTEQIEKIFEVLDGLNVQDNVIAIDSMSDILTPEEIDIASKAVAFIVYNGQLYIKKSGTVSSAVFDVVFSITASTVITFNSSEITASLVDGSLSISNSSVSTYSATQIDTKLGAKADITYVDAQLALKANLAGANFTGSITAPEIIELMAGYTYGAPYASADYNFTAKYVGAVKTGNKLTLVVFASAEMINNKGAYSGVGLGSFIIPASVASKIVPYQVGSFTDICAQNVVPLVFSISQNIESLGLVQKSGTQNLNLTLYPHSQMNAGTTYFFRFEITFLLSDSLAS